MRVMTRFRFTWLLVLGLGCLLIAGVVSLSYGKKSASHPTGIPPEKVADYLHSVIQADRTIYTTHVVERMQEKGITFAAEHWEQRNALPLPAQFLKYSGRLAAESEEGRGIRYGLISLWPIHNGPATEFEREALETLSTKSMHSVTGIVKSGKKQFFKAVYPDIAVSKACVSCHNTHLLSPKRDFKLNDVMGGIVVTIPLDS